MRTQLVTLKLGFKVNEQRLKDVVLREPTVADYIAAEVNAPVYRQYGCKAANAGRPYLRWAGWWKAKTSTTCCSGTARRSC